MSDSVHTVSSSRGFVHSGPALAANGRDRGRTSIPKGPFLFEVLVPVLVLLFGAAAAVWVEVILTRRTAPSASPCQRAMDRNTSSSCRPMASLRVA